MARRRLRLRPPRFGGLRTKSHPWGVTCARFLSPFGGSKLPGRHPSKRGGRSLQLHRVGFAPQTAPGRWGAPQNRPRLAPTSWTDVPYGSLSALCSLAPPCPSPCGAEGCSARALPPLRGPPYGHQRFAQINPHGESALRKKTASWAVRSR